jgi:hypothetical protein
MPKTKATPVFQPLEKIVPMIGKTVPASYAPEVSGDHYV